MTTTPVEDADVPDVARRQWEELLVLAHRWKTVHAECEDVRLQCRELVIDLLRKGVRLQDLVGRPFSRALLSRIRKQEGLPMERQRRDAS